MHSRGSISARRTSTARPASPGSRLRRRRARRRRQLGGDLGRVGGDEVPGASVGQLLAPEGGHGGEHPALVRDGLGEDHVVGADPVRGHHQQQAVAGVVELADLPRVDERGGHGPAPDGAARAPAHRASRRSSASRAPGAAAVPQVALQVEGAVEGASAKRHLGVASASTSRKGRPSSQAAPGVALDDAVGVVARQAGGHQRQQDRLAEDQPEGPLGQVGQRPLGVDHQAGRPAPVARRST